VTGTFSIIGRGVILHANQDDCENISSSGARYEKRRAGVRNGLRGREEEGGLKYVVGWHRE
jgi:hypothetical protein